MPVDRARGSKPVPAVPKSASQRAATKPGGRATLIEPTLLCALAIRPAHGYELRKAIEELTDGLVTVDPPGLYRALQRLEQEGLAASSWAESGSGPRKRIYTLTRSGYALLEDWRSFLQRQVHAAQLTIAAMSAVLDVWASDPESFPEGSDATATEEVAPAEPDE